MRNLLFLIQLAAASFIAWALVDPVRASDFVWALANRF